MSHLHSIHLLTTQLLTRRLVGNVQTCMKTSADRMPSFYIKSGNIRCFTELIYFHLLYLLLFFLSLSLSFCCFQCEDFWWYAVQRDQSEITDKRERYCCFVCVCVCVQTAAACSLTSLALVPSSSFSLSLLVSIYYFLRFDSKVIAQQTSVIPCARICV